LEEEDDETESAVLPYVLYNVVDSLRLFFHRRLRQPAGNGGAGRDARADGRAGRSSG
jgi:hypothetical protein